MVDSGCEAVPEPGQDGGGGLAQPRRDVDEPGVAVGAVFKTAIGRGCVAAREAALVGVGRVAGRGVEELRKSHYRPPSVSTGLSAIPNPGQTSALSWEGSSTPAGKAPERIGLLQPHSIGLARSLSGLTLRQRDHSGSGIARGQRVAGGHGASAGEAIRRRLRQPGLALAFEPVEVRGESGRRWFRGFLGNLTSST